MTGITTLNPAVSTRHREATEAIHTTRVRVLILYQVEREHVILERMHTGDRCHGDSNGWLESWFFLVLRGTDVFRGCARLGLSGLMKIV